MSFTHNMSPAQVGTARDALSRVVAQHRSYSALARRLNLVSPRSITRQSVFNWLNRDGYAPVEWVQSLVKVSEGLVTAQDLRPDIFEPLV